MKPALFLEQPPEVETRGGMLFLVPHEDGPSICMTVHNAQRLHRKMARALLAWHAGQHPPIPFPKVRTRAKKGDQAFRKPEPTP
jgi:hypothetical protein